MAYYPDKRQETLLLAGKADKYCDLMHMMTYDQQGGHHSTYKFGIESIQQGLEVGLNSTKLTLGLPFYGRHSVTGDWTTYEDIVQNNHPLVNDIDEVKSRNGFIGFNNIKTIENKVRFSYKSNLGGVMIWEVGQDCRIESVFRHGTKHEVTCPNGEKSSLLTSISRIIIEEENNINNELIEKVSTIEL
jgi:GH18 family chitinase